MFAGYLVVTLVASAFTGLAGIANLIGHEYPRSQADMLRGSPALNLAYHGPW